MKRTLTVKNNVGTWDIPSFVMSKDEELEISVKVIGECRVLFYRLTAYQGTTKETHSVLKDDTIKIKLDRYNANNIEFSLALTDLTEERVIKDDFVIEPLKAESVGTKFEMTAYFQKLEAEMQELREEVKSVSKRLAEYESGGIEFELEKGETL